MTVDLMLKAFLVTYAISMIVFMVSSYMGLNQRSVLALHILLWPIWIALIGIMFVCDFIGSICQWFLENVWGEEFESFYDPDDKDDPEGGSPA